MLLRSNFSSFPHYFIYIFLTSGIKLHILLLNVVVRFIVFLTSATLICRGTDISKCLEFEITRVDCNVDAMRKAAYSMVMSIKVNKEGLILNFL